MTLILGEERLKGTLSMAEAIDLIEEAYQHEAVGQTYCAPRQTTTTKAGWMRLMYAVDFAAGYAAVKAFHLTQGVGVRYVVSLYRLQDGKLLAILDGRELTALRTGAVSGVAARYMAPKDATSVGLLGSGNQAITQLEAMAAELPLTSARVFSPTPQNRLVFAERMSERLNLPVQAFNSAEAAFSGQPVVVIATNAAGPDPVMQAAWLSDPVFVCGIGSTRMTSIEIDLDTFRAAQQTVVDTDHATEEAGDLQQALTAGVLDAEGVWTLAELVERRPEPPRKGITVFKSIGSALQDLALAAGYYHRLKSRTDLIQSTDLASLKTPKPWG